MLPHHPRFARSVLSMAAHEAEYLVLPKSSKKNDTAPSSPLADYSDIH